MAKVPLVTYLYGAREVVGEAEVDSESLNLVVTAEWLMRLGVRVTRQYTKLEAGQVWPAEPDEISVMPRASAIIQIPRRSNAIT